ncbi:MAG TPA: glycoside hydrolase family 9 protein [Opitutaceae bacterium]|nr:glycoside hydrolase family 9 protein [Opitutaceae bacterium]
MFTPCARTPFVLPRAARPRRALLSVRRRSFRPLVALLPFALGCAVEALGAGSDQAIAPADGPRLNQVGLPTWAEKRFIIAESEGVAPGASFAVRAAVGGRVVVQGRLDEAVHDERRTGGERVLTGEFSALRAPGRYELVVAGRAAQLVVGDDCYRALWRDAFRCFPLIRAGVAIQDPETGIAHPASHTGPTAVAGSEERRDVTGGWYNAGDFGRWVHMASITCSYFLHLQDCGGLPDPAFGLPDSTPGSTALLREARWGLEWMLKMQNADGSVMHKVDSEPHLDAWGVAPQDDPYQHFVRYCSSIDAGNFAAVMYQAGRAYRAEDAAFADRCAAAAERAWHWLAGNRAVPHGDPYYVDPDANSEWLRAACERLVSRDDPALAAEVREKLRATQLPPVTWPEPALLGVYSLARCGADAELRAVARGAIERMAEEQLRIAAANAYRVALPPEGYSWGCAERVLHAGSALALAYELTGRREFLDAAGAQLDWLLGHNALGYALVSGHGECGVRAPYHWTCIALGKLMPGWASGGPNAYPQGADKPLVALQQAGTPPARCFLDYCTKDGSWASNEGQTAGNAPLVFLTGVLSRGPRPEEAAAAGAK